MSDVIFSLNESALIWNSLPPYIVDFRSLSSFKRTINNAHVNFFTQYWCSVWFCNLHCKFVHLFSLCIFVVIVILPMWCVSGLRPFITNKSYKILPGLEKNSIDCWKRFLAFQVSRFLVFNVRRLDTKFRSRTAHEKHPAHPLRCHIAL